MTTVTLKKIDRGVQLTGGEDTELLPLASKLAKNLRGSGTLAGAGRGDW